MISEVGGRLYIVGVGELVEEHLVEVVQRAHSVVAQPHMPLTLLIHHKERPKAVSSVTAGATIDINACSTPAIHTPPLNVTN